MSKLLVTVPVCDLRSEPKILEPKDFSHNPLRLSQLLFNERLHLLEQQGEWLFIEALEQPRFLPQLGWHSYRGWVHASEVKVVDAYPTFTHAIALPWKEGLSYGTYLEKPEGRPLNAPFSRKDLIQESRPFLDTPYLWGGRGAYSEEKISGVDCSGIISLLYRAQGIIIPRDAHDQFLKAKPLKKEELQTGDFIFFRRKLTPERVTHVMLYIDPEHYLESPKTGDRVRFLPLTTDYQECDGIARIKGRDYDYLVSYGTLLV